DGVDPAGLRMNDIQALGTHNSYKRLAPPEEIAAIGQVDPGSAIGLDYGHGPLTAQLDAGMRQLEIDVVYDPEGGRYTRPLLAAQLYGDGPVPGFDPAPFAAPGFKAIHVQDIDFRSNCPLFVDCLREIAAWSDAHPDHAPILIMMNAKD